MTRTRKKFPFFLWHRRLGLVALVLMLILCFSGIALNHTESLRLDKQTVESDLLLDWYGLNPELSPVSYQVSDIVISQWDDQLFFNSTILSQTSQILRGTVMLNDIIVIALDNTILLLENSGELIEEMDIGVGNIKHIGTDNKHAYIKNSKQITFMSDRDVINWSEVGHVDINWAQKTDTSQTMLNKMKISYRGQGLTMERVILDLHSGRLFNPTWGIYLMDASAIIMIWLGISGTWIWWSRNRKMKTKRHYQKHHMKQTAVKGHKQAVDNH